MSDKFIPYGQQWIEKEDIEAVTEVLKSDYLTTGSRIDEFEEKFADYVNAEYAVAVSNGTAALHAACFAADINEGDEVITTPLTFAASANCILYQGGTPVFADVDPKTYNIDPKKIEEKIMEKTKAIIPVHFTGQPCQLDRIRKLAEKYNLTVIEDAAHALGATYKSEKIGGLSEMSTFSFHPVKHITTGEGGMVTTDSKELCEKLKQFRNHGITKQKAEFITESDGPWDQEQQFLGYNYRMTDIQAALGISQLKKSDKFLKRRRSIAEEYNEAFKNFRGVEIPYQKKDVNSSWHIYILQLRLDQLTGNREDIFESLREKNLGVNVHYPPVYKHPFYQKLNHKNKSSCRNAELLYNRFITIPLYPKMDNEEVKLVIKRVKKVIKNYLTE